MKLVKEIFINVTAGSTRIAILENGILNDIFIELPDHQRMVGDIYKGRIQNVIPGMQAAFIDIGFHINAFLPFTEISDINKLNDISFSIDDDKKTSKTSDKKVKMEIGDEIMVQVIKEPFLGKGPRVTTEVSLAGNLIVLVPNQNYIGISKKISDKYERKRLKNIIHEFKPKDYGIIVRTIGISKDQKIKRRENHVRQ